MLKQILDLFYRQEIFSKFFAKPQMEAYFKSIIADGQIVTIERDGRIIAFQDYWIINRKMRDTLLRMDREMMGLLYHCGSYLHSPGGKHLYINFTVIDKDYRNQFITIQLAKKIAEKNPEAISVCFHRLDNKAYTLKVWR